MEFFQTNSPIKKVGPNEYIIGDNKIDPLALIKGKELIIDKVTAKNIGDVVSGPDFNDLSGRLDIISGLLGQGGSGSDPLLSTKVNSISGLLYDLIHELDHDPFGGSLSSALGLYFSGHNHSGTPPGTGASLNLSELSGNLNSKIESVSGLLDDLIHELDHDPFGGSLSSALGLYFSGHNHSGTPPGTGASLDLSELSGNLNSKIESVSGFLHSLIQQQPTNSITGTSGNFEFLNITGTLIVNGIDIYPSISGLLENSSTGSADISGIQEEIRELELAIEDLKPDGGSYSFSSDLNSIGPAYFIEFPSVFDFPPRLNVSIEASGQAEIVDHIISGVNTSGYHLVFSQQLPQNTYRAHTMFDSNGEFAGEEAFEVNNEGDIVPSNSPLISDTMWILRNQTDLEVRNNVWRYNTGPEAFTDEISF